ncbi:hypothetical protein BHE74_00058240 [Ensete ventricosum]|nr:hypothetical protein BHE74_00058240 [Ensete ventricosum]
MMQWDLTGSSLGDSSKGSRSSLRTHREFTGRRPEDSLQEYWRLPNWRDDWTTRTLERGWLLAVEPPTPGFRAADDG